MVLRVGGGRAGGAGDGEFRAHPFEESEYGEWTAKALLYAKVFAITLPTGRSDEKVSCP
jgi:hypothetical protein